MFIKLRSKKAFTLVEIMIVVAIIGLLVAIAIPNFVRARRNARKNLCINNLRLLTHSVEQYAIEYGAADGSAPTAAIIMGTTTSYIENALAEPESAAAYAIPAVGADAACPSVATFPEHVLPAAIT